VTKRVEAIAAWHMNTKRPKQWPERSKRFGRVNLNRPKQRGVLKT